MSKLLLGSYIHPLTKIGNILNKQVPSASKIPNKIKRQEKFHIVFIWCRLLVVTNVSERHNSVNIPKMELVFFTETLIHIYHTTRRHTPATSAVVYGLINWE
jgi:hypothetical protein